MKKQPDKQTNTNPDGNGDLKDSTEFFRGVAGTTSQVVYQAASILEEEIAAGIVAAKHVEDSFKNSSKVSSENSDELMQRFRADLHEVIDMVLDLINVATTYANVANQSDITMQSVVQEEKTQHSSNGHQPTLKMPTPVIAGNSIKTVIKLNNNIEEPTGNFGFESTDLVSTSGDRISARQVKFMPSTITMEPNVTKEVTIVVNVPKGKSVGTYSGLIQSIKMDQLQAVLVVHVGQKE